MACNALAAYTRSSFGSNTPSIRGFIAGFPYVERLVDLLEPAIDEAASKPIGEYGADGLKQAIRALVSEVSNIAQISAQSPKQTERQKRIIATVGSPSGSEDPAVEIFSLKSELFDMRQKNSYLESIQKASYAETASLQQEIEGLYATRNKLTKQLTQAKSAFDDALSKKVLECSRLEDRATAAETALESANAERQRLMRHLELAKEDEKIMREELGKLRARLERYRETQVETEKKLIEAKEEASRSVILVTESPKPKRDISKEIDTIVALRREVDAQAEEIRESERERMEDQNEMERQTRLISELEEKLAKVMEDSVNERELAKDAMMKAEEARAELERENEQLGLELRNIEEKMERVAKVAGVRMRDLENWVSEKVKEGPQPLAEWEKLNSAVDGLVFFIQTILSSKPHPFLDQRFVPIGEDLELRNNILTTISQIRELQESLPKVGEFKKFAEVFSDEKTAKELIDTIRMEEKGGELAVVGGICAANSCLVENFRELAQGLENLYQLIPKEQRTKDKHKTIESFVQNSLRIFESMKTFTKTSKLFKGKYSANWDGMYKFLEDLYQIVTNCDDQLRPVFGNIAIAGIPKAAKDKIDALTIELQGLESEMQESFNESLSSIQSERDELKDQVQKAKPEIEEMAKRISQMRALICSKDEEIRFLRDKVEDMEIGRMEMEKTFANFHESNNQIEEQAKIIQNERDRLAQIINERSTRYAKRIEDAVARERKRAESELELASQRANERLQLVNDKLDAKRRKLRAVSKKAKEVAETLDSLLQEKIQTIRALTAKVETKKAKIAHLKDLLMQKATELASSDSRNLSRSRTSALLSPSRADSSDRFLDKLGAILARYDGGEFTWTSARALACANTVVNRLLTLEKRSEEQHHARSPSPRVTKIIRDNSNWRQWALGLLDDGRDMTDEEMRAVIEEGFISMRGSPRPVMLSSGLRARRTLSRTPPPARSRSQRSRK